MFNPDSLRLPFFDDSHRALHDAAHDGGAGDLAAQFDRLARRHVADRAERHVDARRQDRHLQGRLLDSR